MRFRSTAVLAGLILLVSAGVAVAAFSTTVMVPEGIDWKYRLLVASLSAEAGYHLIVWLFVLVGISLCLLRRHRLAAGAALACALTAIVLLARPLWQARALGRTLPARLTAAFGPGTADRAPFSVRALYAPPPARVPFWDGTDGGRRPFEFLPAVGRSPAPCVILLHGGGWFGEGYQDRRAFSLWLARQGYAALALGYRALPAARWPQPREDVEQAIAMLRAEPGRFGGGSRPDRPVGEDPPGGKSRWRRPMRPTIRAFAA